MTIPKRFQGGYERAFLSGEVGEARKPILLTADQRVSLIRRLESIASELGAERVSRRKRTMAIASIGFVIEDLRTAFVRGRSLPVVDQSSDFEGVIPAGNFSRWPSES